MKSVNEEYLYEFSRRGEVLQKNIRSVANVTLEHVIGFWLYPHYRKGFNHWIVEISNFIPAAPKFGNKNKIFNKEVLRNELWEVKKSDLDIYVDDVIEKECPLKPKSSYELELNDLSDKLDVFYVKYIDKLIKVAKANKTIRPSEVKSILIESGFIN